MWDSFLLLIYSDIIHNKHDKLLPTYKIVMSCTLNYNISSTTLIHVEVNQLTYIKHVKGLEFAACTYLICGLVSFKQNLYLTVADTEGGGQRPHLGRNNNAPFEVLKLVCINSNTISHHVKWRHRVGAVISFASPSARLVWHACCQKENEKTLQLGSISLPSFVSYMR